MANNYEVNYEDARFGSVEADKNKASQELEQTYAGMIEDSDSFYQAQIDESKRWAEEQSQIQQEQTDFAIEQIEQQKDQAHKDYIKEQSGAYVDWRKQSNQYGTEAEKMASAGLENTGYSESSQVSMYNTYQNRVATARESFNRAVLNYDNAIKDARLQNNALLAEIAHNALQEQTQLALDGFQYKNQLIIDKTNKQIELDNMYYQRWADVLDQINTENAMAEDARQFDLNYDLQLKQFDEDIRQFDEEIARLKAKDEQENALRIQELELEREKLEEQKRQWEEEMEFEREKWEATQNRSGGGGSRNNSSNNTATINPDPPADSGGSGSNVIQDVVNWVSGIITDIGSTFSNSNLVGVSAMGYGPLSEDAVAKKVASGEVIATQLSNGKISVKKNPNYTKGQSTLDKYTYLTR